MKRLVDKQMWKTRCHIWAEQICPYSVTQQILALTVPISVVFNAMFITMIEQAYWVRWKHSSSFLRTISGS